MKPTKTIDQNLLTQKPWILEDTKTLAIKDKIESIAIPLKDWQDVKIYRGVLTGYNEAFIINTKTKDEILKHCHDDNEKKRTMEIIKPILKGRDIKRYKSDFHDWWIIGTFPPLNLDIEQYSLIKNHLLKFGKQRLEQSGLSRSRKLTKHKWFEMQDQTGYYEEFEKEKIVFPAIMRGGSYFTLDSDKYYLTAPANIIVGNHLHYILPLLASKPCYFFLRTFYMGGGIEGELKVNRLEQLPIPHLKLDIPSEKETYDRLCELGLLMIELHKTNINEERVKDRICEVDSEINRIIYKLYKLTDDEIQIIEDRY